MTQLSIQDAIELGKRHQKTGNLRQAQMVYRQVLVAAPNHPEALHLLGLIEFQESHLTAAFNLINQAINGRPDALHFHANLGHVLAGMGRMKEAIEAYKQALKLCPDFPEVLHALGNAHAALGQALQDGGRIEQGIDAYRKALAAQPGQVEVRNNLGVALLGAGRPDEAVEVFREALAQRGDFPEAWNNLGEGLREMRQLDLAMDAYQTAAELALDWYVPRYNMGTLRLLRGHFRDAWPLLEERWNEPELAAFRRSYTNPQWDGSDLSGKRIILHAEQGFGDAIQFCRYVPMVMQRGGRIIVACPRELLRLLHSIGGVEQWVTPGDPMPAYDLHASLMSLPLLFDTVLETVPAANGPYLLAEEDVCAPWQQRFAQVERGIKVGLAWTGRPGHLRDRWRSLPLRMFGPLAQVPDVQFFSLQIGHGSDQAGTPPSGMSLFDWTHDIGDFADTAGLMENLDLVISVDTAVAHLAGAMGKSVWLLVPFMPDWRWMLDREDSPWYPTMRLFRQPRLGDWDTPIKAIVAALGELRDTRRT